MKAEKAHKRSTEENQEGGAVMSRIVGSDPVSVNDSGDTANLNHPPEVHRKRYLSAFWRHFLEMFAAMAAGMVATCAIFLSVVGLSSWDQVTVRYPAQALLAMAVGMTVPMVAWMAYRRMGWRNSVEMTAAMALPAIPFLCLVWFEVTKSALCGAYCAVTIVAMLGLMFYRRSQYSASRGPTAVSARPSQPARRTR